MEAFDVKSPGAVGAAETLRAMARAVEAGKLAVDRMALYGQDNGFAPAPFDFVMTGRVLPDKALI